MIVKDGRAQLRLKNDLFDLSRHLLIDVPIDNLECRVNDYITVKLKNSQPNICIQGKEVKIRNFEAKQNFHLKEKQEVITPPIILFWTECSILREFSESNYDVRLLPFEFGFDLLKELKEASDPLAKKVFKEQIAKAFEAGIPSEIEYLVSNHFLDCFDRSELEVVLKDFDSDQLRKQRTLVKIVMLEKMYNLGLFKDESSFYARVEKEIKTLSLEESQELFGECISYFGIDLTKEKFESRQGIDSFRAIFKNSDIEKSKKGQKDHGKKE